MRVHSIEKIEELKALRQQGYSINELVIMLAMPKTTIWHHIQKIKLSPECRARIKSNQGGSRKRKEARIEKANIRAKFLLSSRHRSFVIAIAMLYWGEGHKKRCDFINTDGAMIRLYLWIMRNVFEISNNDLIPTIRIFSGMDKEKCLNYWARVASLSRSKFKVRLNDGMTRGRSEYGLCRIVVKNGGDVLKTLFALKEYFIQEINQKVDSPS